MVNLQLCENGETSIFFLAQEFFTLKMQDPDQDSETALEKKLRLLRPGQLLKNKAATLMFEKPFE